MSKAHRLYFIPKHRADLFFETIQEIKHALIDIDRAVD